MPNVGSYLINWLIWISRDEPSVDARRLNIGSQSPRSSCAPDISSLDYLCQLMNDDPSILEDTLHLSTVPRNLTRSNRSYRGFKLES